MEFSTCRRLPFSRGVLKMSVCETSIAGKKPNWSNVKAEITAKLALLKATKWKHHKLKYPENFREISLTALE